MTCSNGWRSNFLRVRQGVLLTHPLRKETFSVPLTGAVRKEPRMSFIGPERGEELGRPGKNMVSCRVQCIKQWAVAAHS
jgi:hypothetical protein